LRERYRRLDPFYPKELPAFDGWQSPPLKLDQVEYQARFELPPTKRATDNQRRRRRLLTILAAVVLVAGVGYGTYWFIVGRHLA